MGDRMVIAVVAGVLVALVVVGWLLRKLWRAMLDVFRNARQG